MRYVRPQAASKLIKQERLRLLRDYYHDYRAWATTEHGQNKTGLFSTENSRGVLASRYLTLSGN